MTHHPDLDELAFLIGSWSGTGEGEYPTIESFRYHEDITIQPVGAKPALIYQQRTRDHDTGEPLHSETGYLRWAGAGRAELALAQPTGITEVHTGSIQGTHLHLRSLVVAHTPTAVEVSDVERHIEVEGPLLRYRMSMAAVGHPLQVHLRATLRRS
ncbi:MAG: FABP family protein [Acidimicrobiia bacterium]|nr:FABP family protein [Acidimicrobiia bacterium]MDH4307739.1 FABP family protein [Acidimicrobiia bacterium]